MDQTMTLATPPALDVLGKGEGISLFLDFDGTLVDIAPTPDSISVKSGLSSGLERLADRLSGRLALISGRSLEDIEQHLGKADIAKAGSHGLDRVRSNGMRLGEEPPAFPDRVIEEASNFVANFDGLNVERKQHGVALHFRGAAEYEAQASAFAELLAGMYDLVVKRGKCVVELVHPQADKASAVRAFMEETLFAGTMPVFVGDDVTDEDGFVAAREFGGFGILVGDRMGSCAKYGLRDPAEVHEWLGL
jgi:trehalose 6-phosphate phosphatase